MDQKHSKPRSYIDNRVKTAAVCLPILFYMLSNKILLTILLIFVIGISYNEFSSMIGNIMNNLFHKEDPYSQIAIRTFLKSPIIYIAFMLCPLILGVAKNGLFHALFIPFCLVVMIRVYNILNVYSLFNFDITSYKLGDLIHSALKRKNSDENSYKEKSDIPIILSDEFIKRLNKEYEIKNTILSYVNNMIELVTFGDLIKHIYTNQYLSYIENIKTQMDGDNLSKENRIQEKEINNKLNYFRFLNFSLYLLALDLLFLFMITFPICTIIELYKTNNGYTYVFQIILIAYQCDNGALLFGKLFGKKNFGFPITPTKTYEGILGAFFLGINSALIYRYLILLYVNANMLGLLEYIAYSFVACFFAILGDFVESFVKRCADKKDSGCLFPGHGGLLDRIDSIVMVSPITLMYFL